MTLGGCSLNVVGGRLLCTLIVGLVFVSMLLIIVLSSFKTFAFVELLGTGGGFRLSAICCWVTLFPVSSSFRHTSLGLFRYIGRGNMGAGV